jgi:amidohydrolase
MAHEELKQRVCAAIDAHAQHLIDTVGEVVYRDPELGFKEVKTSKLVAAEFQRLGLGYEEQLGLTGLKTVVSGGRPGPTVGVIGELDSVLVPDWVYANPETGAAHCCGHNAQLTTMLGVATGLLRSGVLEELAGNVAFFAVPAEETVEYEFRSGLRASGQIEFFSGKAELIRLGAFDDIDMAMMVHAMGDDAMPVIAGITGSANGFVGKQARFIGKAAHAGGEPHKGINALYAAQLALSAINAQRETYQDADTVRIHPILTRGGDLVNVIPSDVRLETMVRGRTAEAIADASAKADRALKAGALAMGATVEITTLAGDMPETNHAGLRQVFKENFLSMYGPDQWEEWDHDSGSSDMGDLAHLMPTIQPNVAGFSGTFHGSDFALVDQYLAYVLPAKLMAMTVIDLLAGDAAGAKAILDEYTPLMTKEEYLAFMRGNNRTEVYAS